MSMFFERAKSLQSQIAPFARKKIDSHLKKDRIIATENNWGASYFYAAVLEQCEPQTYFSIDRAKIDTLYQQFEKATGRACDIESLFARNWLRLVNGKVEISKSIVFSLSNVEKIIGLDNEFAFWKTLHARFQKDKITETDFNSAVTSHQTDTGTILDLAKASSAGWFINSDGQALIGNPVYTQPVIEHLDELLFLKQIYDIDAHGPVNRLSIPKEKLERIVTAHRTAFEHAPSFEEFVAHECFLENGESYALNFQRSKLPFSGGIFDKAGALLWGRLLADSSFKDDMDRIRFWYDRIMHSRFNEWCDVESFFPTAHKDRFLDAALQILLSDPDLVSGEDEYMKLQLDQGHKIAPLANLLYKPRREKFPVSDDIFYYYEALCGLENRWQGQLMFHQESRGALAYYIHQVVRNDTPNSYQRIIALIENGLAKPFLLYKTAFNLYYWNPAAIPYLILNKSSTAFAFCLLWEMEFPRDLLIEKHILLKELLEKSFRLVCGFVMEDTAVDKRGKARIVFQCLLPAVAQKYTKAGPSVDQRQKHFTESSEILGSLRSIFENATVPGSYYGTGQRLHPLWHPDILKEVFDEAVSYSPIDFYQNNTLSLPYIHFDILAWLLKLENNLDIPGGDSLRFKISETILDSYLKVLNTGRQKGWDPFTEKVAEMVPVWSNQSSSLGLIDWKFVFINLEQEALLDKFLNPVNLQLEKTADKYDNYNAFVIEKIRTHLSILLFTHDEISKDKTALATKGLPVLSVLEKLESAISNLIIQFCVDDPAKGRQDIFSLLYERTYWNADRQELLPVVASAMTRFKESNKNRIMSELVKSEPLLRTFKLLDYMTSEKDKNYLVNLISNQEIAEFFLNNYQGDTEYVLQRLAQDKTFREKAEKALEIWEKKSVVGVNNEKDNHAIMCFRMKLLLAFHDMDEDKLLAIPQPVLLSSYASRDFSSASERDFYKALIFLEKGQPEDAYKMFDGQLKISAAPNPVIALNRFASKNRWADQVKEIVDKKRLYQEATHEWTAFEDNLPKKNELEFIKDKIWHNKLTAYHHLDMGLEFDKLYESIEKPLQLRSDFLELRIVNFVKRDMLPQADALLTEAENYHRLNDGSIPDFLRQLHALTDTDANIKALKAQYLNIFSKMPETLIKILPEKFARNLDLPEFILNELVEAATDMLTFINSISSINIEDKYSDLLVLALSNRFMNFGWKVAGARGGFPESGKYNPGEIDFAIASGTERMATCEAFNLKGENISTTQKHLRKIFNYDPARKLFYVITYYLGDASMFMGHWEGYKSNLASILRFPPGFELVPAFIVDTSDPFGSASVRTARSAHGASTLLYHIFININYQIPTKPKTVGKKKGAAPKKSKAVNNPTIGPQ